MQIQALFFDLDGTLYPNGVGIWNAISEKMNIFMNQELGIPIEQVPNVREGFFHKYGTTLRGLQNHYDIDPADYLNYVHNIPVNEILKPDNRLRNLLVQDKSRKWILTNSDRDHSGRVLEALGIRDQFEGIVDVWATDFKPKPAPHFFETAMRTADLLDPSSIIFFDDISKNVLGGKEFGFVSVYVGEGIIAEGIDHQIMTIHDFQKIKKDVLSPSE